MTYDPLALAGFGLASLAFLAFVVVAFFGDLFVKTDRQLRLAMDWILWSVLLSLVMVSCVVAFRH